jgi:hypothetical protein
MKSPCDVVTERIALGEPLGDQAEHAASCASCRAIAALPTELGASHSEADPGLGFSARITAGAQHRVVVRRRRRIALGLATAVAASVFGAFVMTRTPDGPIAVTPSQDPAGDTQTRKDHGDHKDPWKDPQNPSDDNDDVKALLRMANVESSSHFTANWKRIERPLAPYRALVKGLIQ